MFNLLLQFAKKTQLIFILNPACNKALSKMLVLMEPENSNIKISLNTLYQKEGSIFTWLNTLPDGKVEYIHIDENSYLGKIINLLSKHNTNLNKFNSVLDRYKISSEKKVICLSYLLEKILFLQKIIFYPTIFLIIYLTIKILNSNLIYM